MTSTRIRLGTASPASQATTAETLSQLSILARRAAGRGCDLLLLPEAYVGGYPRGADFGCVVGGRSAEGRDAYLRYFRGAVDLGDSVGDGGAGAGDTWVRREWGVGGAGRPAEEKEETAGGTRQRRGDGTREELECIARESGVFLVVGCIEKAGGSLYCAVVYVCPKLGAIGKRRKVMPTGSERLVWAQGSPATLKAVSTTIRGVRINLAAAICWENYMPLVRQALYAQNINLYLAPTADGRDAWLALMRTVAIEGRCFVVSSNMCVRSKEGQPSTNGQDRGEAREEGRGSGRDTTTSPKGSRRRNSCLTEEGFEIALPSPTVRRGTSKRRQSIFDEDGNEIVLSCKGSALEDAVSDGPVSPIPTSGGVPQNTTTLPAVRTGLSDGEFVSRGGSSIVSPFGDVIAGPQWEDGEGIIYADVDFDECIKGRLDLDTAGSYSRNDSFKFSVQGLVLDPLPY